MLLHELPTHGAGPNGGLEIFRLIPLVMNDIVQVPKLRKRKAGFGGEPFAFRGIDDALNFISPALVKHGVTPSVQLLDAKHETCNIRDKDDKPKTMNRSEVVMAVTFFAPDGSWVRNICGGMATDYNDGTASNKAHAAAEKYNLFFGLMVPVERVALEDGDQDEEQGDIERAPGYVEKSGDAVKEILKPGDNKSEQLFQVGMTAMKKAFDDRKVDTLKEMQHRARNNASFNEEQKNTMVRTAAEYIKKLTGAGTTGNATRPAGTQPPATKPAGTQGTKAPSGAAPHGDKK